MRTLACHVAAVSMLMMAVAVAQGSAQTALANPDSQNCVAYVEGSCTRETAMAVAPAPESIHARFACNGGKWIDATFVNGSSNRVELALSDGRKLALPQALSGSGARYATADEGFVFWNKGNTAFIEEAGKTTYDGCATKR